MAFEKSPDEIGVLFAKESKAGKKYYSGTLNGQDIVGWPKLTKSGAEIIEIMKSKPRDGKREEPQKRVASWEELTGGEQVPF